LAVKLRLKRMGRKKRPFYRIVAADSRSPRNGRFIEELGYYDPLTDPMTLVVKEDRAMYWLQQGAVPSDTVKSLLKTKGIIFRLDLMKRGLDETKIEEELKKWELLQVEKLKRQAEKKALEKERAKARKKEKKEQEQKESAAAAPAPAEAGKVEVEATPAAEADKAEKEPASTPETDKAEEVKEETPVEKTESTSATEEAVKEEGKEPEQAEDAQEATGNIEEADKEEKKEAAKDAEKETEESEEKKEK
jgi:small subunit ribosomal protein S16